MLEHILNLLWYQGNIVLESPSYAQCERYQTDREVQQVAYPVSKHRKRVYRLCYVHNMFTTCSELP